MEEIFKGKIEELKKADMDVKKNKKYIIIVKRFLDDLFNKCKGEYTQEECLEEFLEYYAEELKIDAKYGKNLEYAFAQYNSYKVLLNYFNKEKGKFKKIVSAAKEKENKSNKEQLFNSLDVEQQLITSMRVILRRFPNVKNEELQPLIQKCKKNIGEVIKQKLIASIQDSVAFLEEYGLLDEYIDESNKSLKELGLENISFIKRNPLPDEMGDGRGNIIKYDDNGELCKYDENGKIITDGENLEKYEEDIGVLDSFDTEYLESLSPESLLMMDASWKSLYFEERIEMSKAISTIRILNLWPDLLEKGEDFIENIDDELMSNALKRDLALTFLCKNNNKITPRMKTQYSRFIEESDMLDGKGIEEELKEVEGDVENLINTSNNLALEKCLIIRKLKDKEIPVKNWGVIGYKDFKDKDGKDIKGKREIVCSIENPDFRGDSIINIPEELLKSYFDTENLKLPKYKKADKINTEYSGIMSKMYLPVSNYFKKQIKKKYDDNPSSGLFARLAGKKAKKAQKAQDVDDGQEL